MNKERLREIFSRMGYSGKRYQGPVKRYESERCEGFERILIEYAVGPDERVRSFLLLPEGGGSVPLCVAIHPHEFDYSAGKSEVAGLGTLGKAENAYGAALAKAGFAVLCPDLLTFEARRELPYNLPENAHVDEDEKVRASYLYYDGSSLQANALNDLSAGIDAALTFDRIDKSRIFAFGHEVGGQEALWLALADDRVRGYVSSCGASLVSERAKTYENIDCLAVYPDLYRLGDYDVVSGLRPDKFAFLTFPRESVRFPGESAARIKTAVECAYGENGLLSAEWTEDDAFIREETLTRMIDFVWEKLS